MRWIFLGCLLAAVGCGGVNESIVSAGHVGCPPSVITIQHLDGAPRQAAWRATCFGQPFICSRFDGVVSCALESTPGAGGSLERGAEGAAASAADHVLVRPAPPEVAACVDRGVAIEALFDAAGRAVELRPWPGETEDERRCVARVLVELDVPDRTGPTLVRFEPRSPWGEGAERD
ncbi:MAG: hypothetical protein KF901_03805 [Myxococcales bacterium]|nr:hypothetical protein [Myxococcales bacterium]